MPEVIAKVVEGMSPGKRIAVLEGQTRTCNTGDMRHVTPLGLLFSGLFLANCSTSDSRSDVHYSKASLSCVLSVLFASASIQHLILAIFATSRRNPASRLNALVILLGYTCSSSFFLSQTLSD